MIQSDLNIEMFQCVERPRSILVLILPKRTKEEEEEEKTKILVKFSGGTKKS